MKVQNEYPAANGEIETLVSIIMPAYNAEKFISKSIESVIHQTHQNWELIIVNDDSSDNTVSIATEYEMKDKRIHVVHQIPNAGCAQARNLGVSKAIGQYIAFLDSDDLWDEKKLEKQLKLLSEKRAQLVYSSYDFIDENDDSIKKPFNVATETNYKMMLVRNEIGCSTVVLGADLLQQHKFQKEFYHEDYVLWMELLSLPVVAVGVTECLTHYRVVSTSRSYNKMNAAKWRWKIYRNALNMSLVESVLTFLKYAIEAVKKHYLY